MGLCCRLNSCCCGCSLKSGTVFVGVMELIAVSAVVIICSLIIVFLDGFPPGDINMDVDTEKIFISAADRATLRNGCIATAAFNGFLFLLSVMLLCGVGQRTAGLFLPWIIYESIVIIATLVIGIWMIVVSARNKEKNTMAFHITYTSLSTLIRWYFVSVVHSHYKQVQKAGYTV